MSFILDALKKSESDRQKQSGPALFEVKVAPPKARFPLWAIAIVALLVINMIIVGWMLLRRPSHTEQTAATNGQPADMSAAQNIGQNAASIGASPAAQRTPNSTSANQGQYAPANQQGSDMSRPPERDQSEPTLAGNAGGTGGARDLGQGRDLNANRGANGAQDTIGSSGGGSGGQGPADGRNFSGSQGANGSRGFDAAQTSNGGGGRDLSAERDTGTASNPHDASALAADASANPDDYAPASDPAASLFKGHVRRGTESGLMLYQDLAVTQGANLPQLRLDLHVYAAKPQDRFALINMHKMHEGDTLQGGVKIEAITPDGVIMSHNGSKFLLPRE